MGRSGSLKGGLSIFLEHGTIRVKPLLLLHCIVPGLFPIVPSLLLRVADEGGF